MRKSLILAGVCALALTAACSKVDPGHVGVRVDNLGTTPGVEGTPLGVGWYWTWFSQRIYEYPIYTQNTIWTRSHDEGRPVNEELSFQDKNGLSMTADVAISFNVEPSKVPFLFQKYRQDMTAIIDGPVRNAVRDSLVRSASVYSVEEVYGPKKTEVLSRAEADVRQFFAPFGLRVERLYWASDIRFPDEVKAQISAKISAEQAAFKEQANIAVVQAQAQQKIAEAEGKARAITIEGDALRANPAVIEMRKIEKWDGKLPQVTGGGTPLINIK